MSLNKKGNSKPFTVGIIGGGVAGAIAALKLTDLGIKTHLFESKSSLISGPPICHLHAGGNLYREISDQQCIELLEQSIDTVRAFPQAINYRPTVIAVPQQDKGEIEPVLARLYTLKAHYEALIFADPLNKVLGDPDDYFRTFSREELEELSQQALPETPENLSDWMIPVAKSMPLDNFKYPLILVQEYGFSVFRMAAIAQLGLENHPDCDLQLAHHVEAITPDDNGWTIQARGEVDIKNVHVDFLINAAGFKMGAIDDLAETPRQRLVEYKAAYLACWDAQQGIWPEVIVHGERGTPNGMAQFTPYAERVIQLHGMTQEITLFAGGLVESDEKSSQPQLPLHLLEKIDEGWQEIDIHARTEKAIKHLTQWLPQFSTASVGGKPLCGAQQIPGTDPDLRSASASLEYANYARIELVKASSGLEAIGKILQHLEEKGVLLPQGWQSNRLSLVAGLPMTMIEEKALALTKARHYPDALAKPYPSI